jgi:hypothetical protein
MNPLPVSIFFLEMYTVCHVNRVCDTVIIIIIIFGGAVLSP